MCVTHMVLGPQNMVDSTAKEEHKEAKGKAKTPTRRQKKGKKAKTSSSFGYYRVSCKDNGVGMPHKSIPEMFGRGA